MRYDAAPVYMEKKTLGIRNALCAAVTASCACCVSICAMVMGVVQGGRAGCRQVQSAGVCNMHGDGDIDWVQMLTTC